MLYVVQHLLVAFGIPQENTALKQHLAAAEAATTRKTTEMAILLKNAQEYIGQLTAERKQVDNKFHAMKTDLITRLQNACTQRDEARGRVGTQTLVSKS